MVVCVFWYVPLYTAHAVLCESPSLMAVTTGHLFLMLHLTGKGTDCTDSAFCSRWENRGRVGLKNWLCEWEMGTSGVVVYLPSKEVTKQFYFICWLYWFICSINTLIPFLFLCTTVFLFPFQFAFEKSEGWINALHIHKETVYSIVFLGQWDTGLIPFNESLNIRDESNAWNTAWIKYMKETYQLYQMQVDSKVLWWGYGAHSGWWLYLYL